MVPKLLSKSKRGNWCRSLLQQQACCGNCSICKQFLQSFLDFFGVKPCWLELNTCSVCAKHIVVERVRLKQKANAAQMQTKQKIVRQQLYSVLSFCRYRLCWRLLHTYKFLQVWQYTNRVLRFADLVPLLLCHGRRAYRRVATFLCYYFYKNVALAFGDLIWAHQNNFSGEVAYPEWLSTSFNAVFTWWPVIIVLAFDQDLPDPTSNAEPRIYMEGIRRKWFNLCLFAWWMLSAAFHGSLAWILPSLLLGSLDYEAVDFWRASTTSFTMVIIIVALKLALHDFKRCSLSCLLPIVGSISSYITVLFLLGYVSLGQKMQPNLAEGDPRVPGWIFSNAVPILLIFASPLSLLPDMVALLWVRKLHPSPLFQIRSKNLLWLAQTTIPLLETWQRCGKRKHISMDSGMRHNLGTVFCNLLYVAVFGFTAHSHLTFPCLNFLLAVNGQSRISTTVSQAETVSFPALSQIDFMKHFVRTLVCAQWQKACAWSILWAMKWNVKMKARYSQSLNVFQSHLDVISMSSTSLSSSRPGGYLDVKSALAEKAELRNVSSQVLRASFKLKCSSVTGMQHGSGGLLKPEQRRLNSKSPKE